jgi:glycosyltransferase involved in cell wall biosynthesis
MNAAPPLVSIVTPVYNGAEHLARCMDSVLAQTYQHWDYTIVNNCSSDKTAEIARSYAANDLRFRVHENREFLRAVPNHNVALRQISPKSKYCKIAFADDLLLPECLQRMVAVAEEYPSVGIVGAYGLQGRKVMWTGLPYPEELFSGRDICRLLFLEGVYVFGTSHSLLYRSDLVRSHNPFFNESNLHADSEVCCALLNECDFGFVHQVLTVTTERPGSLREFTNDYNTLIAGQLYELVNYGPLYLTSTELESCLETMLNEYYTYLADYVGFKKDRRFWEYHRRKLTEAGVGYERGRLADALLRRLINAALNPKHTTERLLARLGSR